MTSLQQLLKDTNAEIDRLCTLEGLIRRIDGFVEAMQAAGLGVEVTHYGGFDFHIEVSEILDKVDATQSAIGSFAAQLHGTASADFRRTDAIPEAYGDVAEIRGPVSLDQLIDLRAVLCNSIVQTDGPTPPSVWPDEIPAGLPVEATSLPDAAGAVVDQVVAVPEVASGDRAAADEGPAGDVADPPGMPESIAIPPVGQAPVDPAPPEPDQPAPKAAEAKPGLPALWTEAEEAELIRLKRGGASWPEIGRAIGRPHEGCKFRWYTQLREKSEAAAAQEPDPVADVAPVAVPKAAPVAATHTGGDAMTAYLAGLSFAGRWTPNLDIEILDLALAGWTPDMIALEVGFTVADLKARFDVLTDKRGANWKRADVLACLQRIKTDGQAAAA